MKFSEAVNKFDTWLSFGQRKSTRGTYRVQLLQFALYMRNCDIEAVGLDDVVRFLKDMQDLGWNQNNFLAKTAALKKFFEFYRKQGITKFDPELVPIMEGEYKFPKVADPINIQKLLDIIPLNNDPRHIRNRAMILMVRDSGMRLSEFLSLDIEDIDIEKQQALIKTLKSKRLHPIRMVFWKDEANEALKAWLKKREYLAGRVLKFDPKALFISVTGAKTGRRLTKSGATEITRRLSHEAGLDEVLNWHSIRHLYGRTLAEQDADSANIATMMGHSHVDSSRPYTIMTGHKMKDFYDKHMRK